MRDTQLKLELKEVMADREKWDEIVTELVKKKRSGQRWLVRLELGRDSPSQALLRCA